MTLASVDIATRVYNHNWKIDPIVRSLIDNDFYKLLMCQFILQKMSDTHVTLKLINRTQEVRLADIIDLDELRQQLDHIRTLRLTRGESTWLRGNVFYGHRQMFRPSFIDWFEKLELPEYKLSEADGQFELSFSGKWPEVMLWEIPALATITELRSRAVLKKLGKFELQVLYARAMTRLWNKIRNLRQLDLLQLVDFGTRRRHSYLWQDWCVQAMISGLGNKFIGTSNCHIAMQRDVEAIGTNAHELQMVYAALAKDDHNLVTAQYRVLKDWQNEYAGNLRVILSDTYGTPQFLKNAPDWISKWTAVRVDSGDSEDIGEMAIRWWHEHGEDSVNKLLIFSDGLDDDKIIKLYSKFTDRVRVSFGWGTLLTNDFRSLVPDDGLAPFSLVCKVVSANGRPTVKLSDNPHKATGDIKEIHRYQKVFGTYQKTGQKPMV